MASSSPPLDGGGGGGGGNCRRFVPAWVAIGMMALGVALMIGPLAVAGHQTVCDKPTEAEAKCEHELGTKDNSIVMDCTGAKDVFVPPKMGDTFDCSVCAAAKKWEKVDEVCEDGNIATMNKLSKEGIGIRWDGDRIHIIHLGYKKERPFLVQGSCKNSNGSMGAFFNVTVKKSDAFFALNGVVMSVVMAIAATGLLSFH